MMGYFIIIIVVILYIIYEFVMLYLRYKDKDINKFNKSHLASFFESKKM